jgi:asparagine synthase (glutamine-hydrolysing)
VDRFPLALAKPVFRALAAVTPRRVRGAGFLQILGDEPVHRYHRLMTYGGPYGADQLLTASARRRLASTDTSAVFADLAEAAGTDDYVSRLQFIDVNHYLPDDILAKVDRTSMLTSLETRVPLLDHVVMEHVARIPAGLKLRDGDGKHIFKAAMRDRLPTEIVSRRKMGFGVPLVGWFRKELRDFTQDIVLDSTARQRDIVDQPTVQRMFEDHLHGVRDYSAPLWAVLSFELWCRAWGHR